MPRVRRRGHRLRGFHPDQVAFVLLGVPFPNSEVTDEQFAQIWWAHRDEMNERFQLDFAAPQRPFGFWEVEAPGKPLRDERDGDALIRLRIPLTAKERHYLEREQPVGPLGAGLTTSQFTVQWLERYRDRLACRRDWHAEEGRESQAALFAGRLAEVAAEIERRIAACHE